MYRVSSSDGGATWVTEPYQRGLPPADVSDLKVHPATGVLRAAILGRGVWEVDTDTPIGVPASTTGIVTLLRVQEVGASFGEPGDEIDAEVVFTLDTEPGEAFGFPLRTDPFSAANGGMLAVLRRAFADQAAVLVLSEPVTARNHLVLRIDLSPSVPAKLTRPGWRPPSG